MKKQSFIQGTMILVAAGLIVKIIGFVYRIALSRVIGSEGIGLFQMAFPMLILVLTLVTGGFPVAISKMVAESEAKNNKQRVRGILRISMWIVFGLSILFTAVTMVAAPWISRTLLTDPRVYYSLIAIAPIIPIVGVSQVFRGYFQGKQNMIPTATAQILEQIIRIFTVLFFAKKFLHYGIEYAAAGAMIGIVAGEMAGLLLILYHFWQDQRVTLRSVPKFGKRKLWSEYARPLTAIAIPVTGSKIVGSITLALEPILIAQSLALAGLATSAATSFYGQLAGMAIPILLFPTVLTYSISVSLIPSLSEAAANEDWRLVHKRLHQALRLALVIGAPCTVIMYVLAQPLSILVYNDSSVGELLKMMAPFAVFLYFQGPLAATLQAMDRAKAALRNTTIGAILKIATIVFIASRPEFGIKGAIYSVNVNMTVVTLLHFISVARALSFTLKVADMVKVGFAMFIMGWASFLLMVFPVTPLLWLQFIITLMVSSSLYLFLLVQLKIIDRHDLSRLPLLRRFF